MRWLYEDWLEMPWSLRAFFAADLILVGACVGVLIVTVAAEWAEVRLAVAGVLAALVVGGLIASLPNITGRNR